MGDTFFRTFLISLLNISMFGFIYLYGRKAHPQLAVWLSVVTCVVMIILARYQVTWIGASLILSMVYLFILRKPGQQKEFQQLFAANNIYTTTEYSTAALAVLGNKNWRYASGILTVPGKESIPYSFWQGSTSSRVSVGQYGTTTSYTYYLAFIFRKGSVSDLFKQRAIAAADKSHYSLGQKIKFFFQPDTETPELVTTATDGSFIIQYCTIPDVEYYTRRINWIKENIRVEYQAMSAMVFN